MSKGTAVVLLSGGLDSATTLAIARNEGYEVHALTFRYGQRHEVELQCARGLALKWGVKSHVFIDIPAQIFAGSALSSLSNLDVPRNRDIGASENIPDTYVPARNILFLSYALAYGETVGADALFIGANAVDYSGYPDCRPEFFEAFAAMANVGTRAGVEGKGFEIKAPLLSLTKSEIIRVGNGLGLDYGLTHSCYDPYPDGSACGTCDSCLIRKKGFLEAGIPDPTRYGPPG